MGLFEIKLSQTLTILEGNKKTMLVSWYLIEETMYEYVKNSSKMVSSITQTDKVIIQTLLNRTSLVKKTLWKNNFCFPGKNHCILKRKNILSVRLSQSIIMVCVSLRRTVVNTWIELLI